MKRNAFGQLILPPYIRMADDGGTGGGKEFTPPSNQEELDKLINGAVARTHKQYEGLKDKAEQWDALQSKPNQEKPKDDDKDKPSGVSGDDVKKQINDALAAERKELALERISDRLDKALEGRTFSASKLFALDRSQFVKEDGKTVDDDAIKTWVEQNSAEMKTTQRRVPGQGDRDGNASGGTVQAGRDLYDNHKTPRKD